MATNFSGFCCIYYKAITVLFFYDCYNHTMKKNIWIVDDDYTILEVLQILLSEQNYTLKVIGNPNEVLNSIHTGEQLPDLMFIDVHMAAADGISITKQIKSSDATKNIKVVLMTADIHIDEKAREAQADDFLKKPFAIEDFMHKVTQHLEN